jgi:Alginate lyase
MNRRAFLAAITALAAAQSKPSGCLLVSVEQLERMRVVVKQKPSDVINESAGKALKAGPWSVTFHRPTGMNLSATEHDYFSEGPYWWPDPKNPTGPYIRKDGQRNPARFMGNRTDLGSLCEAVLALGMGAALMEKTGCVDHAALILSAWFIDPKTRMNANLEFGQAVRGINTGRGTGLIDTVSFIHLVQGIALLEAAAGLDAGVSAGTRKWFSESSNWMTTSKKGLDEKKSGNNHATWWTAQVAAYAMFTANASMQKMTWEHYRNYLVPEEIRPDGSCPREEARTQSLSYSSMNLDAFSVICRLGQMDGQDLWHYHAPNGVGVDRAFHYLAPYLLDPTKWKKEQMTGYSAGGHIFPGLAGIGLPSNELLTAYRKLDHDRSPWIQFIDLAVETA